MLIGQNAVRAEGRVNWKVPRVSGQMYVQKTPRGSRCGRPTNLLFDISKIRTSDDGGDLI